MNRCGNDEWSLQPPSVRSKFILQLGSIDFRDIRVCPTEPCGFGWRFGVSQVRTPSSASTKIQIMADPSAVRGTSLDSLAITVTVETLCKSEAGTLPEEITQKHSVNITSAPEGWLSLGEYAWLGDPKTPLMCIIHVVFSSALGLNLPTTPSLVALQILSDSLSGLDRTDIKFYLFSKRNNAGRKTHPLPIFASTQVLRGKSSHLDSLLTISGFKESALVDLDSTPPDLANFSDAGYDYDSDSDLDSDDEDEKLSAPDPENPGDPPSASRSSPEVVSETRAPRRIGRIVYIPDTSHKTWKTLLWYLYTGEINFLPLRSRGQDPPPITIDRPRPTCSPKSMYRLADKLGMPELRNLSLAALRSGITQNNVMQESFSKFTSLYPEVQETESDFLITHFASIPPGEFARIHQLLSEGGHPHSLALLWEIAQKSLRLSIVKPASPPLTDCVAPLADYTAPFGGWGRGRGRGRW